jgi:hypothetical protein
MNFDDIQAKVPSGIAVGVVRSSASDRHWNVRFWNSEQMLPSDFSKFELLLKGRRGETLEELIDRGLPVVLAAMTAMGS